MPLRQAPHVDGSRVGRLINKARGFAGVWRCLSCGGRMVGDQLNLVEVSVEKDAGGKWYVVCLK